MRNKIAFLIMIIFTIFLTGCWDTTEPQRMYYINAVGVDFNDNQYEVYLQIINFADLAKSEQPNPDIVPTEVGYAKGKTIEEAIFELYRSIDQKNLLGPYEISYIFSTSNGK